MRFIDVGVVMAVLAASSLARCQAREGASYFESQSGFCAQSDSFQLKWSWRIGSIETSGVLGMPFDRPGDIAPLEHHSLLTGGLNSRNGQGYLTKVAFDVATGSVQAHAVASVATGWIDPAHVWSNGSDVLVLDYRSGMLFGSNAPVDLAGAAPGLPALVLSPIADGSNMPTVLGDPASIYRLRMDSEPGAPDACIVGHDTAGFGAWGLRFRVQKVQGAWRIAVVDDFAGAYPEVRAADVATHVAPSGDLELRIGPGTGPFAVRDVVLAWDCPAIGKDMISRCDLHHVRQLQAPLISGLLVWSCDHGLGSTMSFGLGFDILGGQCPVLGPLATEWGPDGRAISAFSLGGNNPACWGLEIAVQFVGLLPTAKWIASDVVSVVVQ